MEENILKAISYFSAAFFIITAVTLFFTLYNNKNEIMDTVSSKICEKGPVYETNYVDIPKNSTVSGAFIIGCIKNGLETDISVDSVLIPQNTDISAFDYDIVDYDSEYNVEYVFNTSGELVMVKYRKKGGEP
jgi:hypothetical protein